MKQLLQDLRSGKTIIEEVPCPQVKPHHLLIETTLSLISPGTERMLVQFGKASYLEKAKQQPDKVKQVIEKIGTDGLVATYKAVQSKLDQPIPLGYSNVGIVRAVGAGVSGFNIGDRVVSNGAHSEMVLVPANLSARIPDEVDDRQASITVLAAIGLQGIRLLKPEMGETIAVVGLGLIGLLAVQLLKASGVRVLGIDINEDRVRLAQSYGVDAIALKPGESPLALAQTLTQGRGVDGVLLTLASSSSQVIHDAAEICRARGRIVLTGTVGLDLRRDDFYKKELSFQVSCSYGPGRYDERYEQLGQDYPLQFVRFTAQRNFETVLTLLREGKLSIDGLISSELHFREASLAYQEILNGDALGILFRYEPSSPAKLCSKTIRPNIQKEIVKPIERPVLGVIGAGSYTQAVLLPALSKSGATIKAIASSTGTSAAIAARKFKIPLVSSDYSVILNDPEISAVFITTQHNSHCDLICKSLEAGKHVFVEKPLCLTTDELKTIKRCQLANPHLTLMVGFNRRFSPLVTKLKELLTGRSSPLLINISVNAGQIPANSWIHNPTIGGGRIIGEGCHFVDLLHSLTDSDVVRVATHGIPRADTLPTDTFNATLTFGDGSIGTIQYFATGSKRFPKERITVAGSGSVWEIDNFRSLTHFAPSRTKKTKLWQQNKGHIECLAAFIAAIKSGAPAPISWETLEGVTATTIKIDQESSSPSRPQKRSVHESFELEEPNYPSEALNIK